MEGSKMFGWEAAAGRYDVPLATIPWKNAPRILATPN
tara:strand:- start:632 stop:742 length:111 start_codon:yes stop_codon:yes gene_type:complete